MTDTNAQVRAGSNIGNEPSAGNYFVAKAGGAVIDILTPGRTTILEGVEGTARVGTVGPAVNGGRARNKSIVSYDLQFVFIDDEGNEANIGAPVVIVGGAAGSIAWPASLGGVFALNPGEKVVVDTVVSA